MEGLYDRNRLSAIYGGGGIMSLITRAGRRREFWMSSRYPTLGLFEVTEPEPGPEAQSQGPARPITAPDGSAARSITARLRARGRSSTLLTGLGG